MPTASREQAYPQRLRSMEEQLVAQRRARVDAPSRADAEGDGANEPAGQMARGVPLPGAEPEDASEHPLVGLALSGGGIRSATFSLGLLQALARSGLMGRLDYLSTVSGGGYTGAFLGCLFQRWRSLHATAHPAGGAARTTPAAAVQELLVDPQSWPCHWLRECGRYLIPNRGSDEAIMLAAFLRNWFAVQVVFLVLLLFPLILYRLADVLARQAAAATALAGVAPPPAAVFLAALVAIWLVPASLAYWLAGPLVALIALLATASAGFAQDVLARGGWPPSRLASGLAVLSFTLVLTLLVGAYYRYRYPDLAERRRYLTAGLAIGLQATGVVLGLAVVDALGLAARDFLGRRLPMLTLSGIVAMLGSAAAVVQRIAPRFLAYGKGRLAIPGQLVAAVVAIALVGVESVVLAASLHGLGATALAAGLLGVVLASVLLGQSDNFLNLSTHATIYAARLTRAYLGATNATRQRYHKPLSDPIEGDDVPFRSYAPWTEGGPLHVVNATLNETMSGETQVEFRDRKGMNVAFGACGLSVGARHHAAFEAVDPVASMRPGRPTIGSHDRMGLERVSPPEPFQVFVPDRARCEAFGLGRLVAISGAAFTTGLGSRTSLGLSLLLGLANVRMGYWWNSGTGPRDARGGLHSALVRLLPVQAHLLEEMLARFYGPADRLWYLSDGGHFENTGVYELVRRRLPFIIACDNGSDPSYSFTDAGNLVRKLRLDFGAQVRFLEADELGRVLDPSLRSFVVPWSAFAAYDGSAAGRGNGYATLADVTYFDSDERTTILFVKPALRGDETADVLTYWSRHPEFPQQSTLDQFFDEEQWESYRRLGDSCGTVLFRTGLAGGWSPALMAPLPGAASTVAAGGQAVVGGAPGPVGAVPRGVDPPPTA
jgi:hypothetical protein